MSIFEQRLINWQTLPDGREKYKAYLASPQWGKLRQAVIMRSSGMCELCKVNSGTQVHHQTYAHLYAEPLTDLLLVCELCHKQCHGLTAPLVLQQPLVPIPEAPKEPELPNCTEVLIVENELEIVICASAGIRFSYHSGKWDHLEKSVHNDIAGAVDRMAYLFDVLWDKRAQVFLLDYHVLESLISWNRSKETIAVSDKNYEVATIFKNRVATLQDLQRKVKRKTWNDSLS